MLIQYNKYLAPYILEDSRRYNCDCTSRWGRGSKARPWDHI